MNSVKAAASPSTPAFPESAPAPPLIEALQSLVGLRDAAAIHRVLATQARALTGADRARVLLREDDHCVCVVEEPSAATDPPSRTPLALRDALGDWERLLREDLVLDELPAGTLGSWRGAGVHSLLAVPLRSGIATDDPACGALAIGWCRAGAAGAEPRAALQALARAGSAALANARAWIDLERRLRERTAELDWARAELQKLSVTDEMTGLANRRGFYLLAEQALRHAGRRGMPCMLAFLDADGLTHVNETLGHDVGDSLIVDLAQLLRQTFRASDIVARMGGDEFCVMVLEPGDDAHVIRQRIMSRLDAFNRRSTRPYKLSASLGIVCSPPEAPVALDAMLARADEAMYLEKATKQAARGRAGLRAAAR